MVSPELPDHGPPALPSESATETPVVVIGCGESGILAGIRLKQANIPFTIVEKNAGPGGTWWENRYPGARVDVANHFYCYSFEPNDDWAHFFSTILNSTRRFAALPALVAFEAMGRVGP